MSDGQVPAASDAQVVALRHQYNHTAVGGKFMQGGGGAVGRMVVDHDDIEREVTFLAERAAHGVGDGAFAVAHGNDHAAVDRPVVGLARCGIVQLVGS